ncbi:caspase family protein [Dactylosporangium sp. NPDC005572]|uniref:caspase, EACC1-associated type n=1 Tax=Dactylosporangium sp. NPDC005572 TaxID=3156889 RepID=UPI0033B24953
MLPDPHRSRAVLVGSGAYTELEPLPAVPANLRALQELLTDPRVWGLPPEHCRVIDDPASTDVIRDALHEACRDASDGLVFYYAGHGVVEPDGLDLYLTTPRTSRDPIHAAVRYEDVRRLIAASLCRSKVVLLDCCYSGLALAGAMGDATRIADRVSIDASYVMTATAETRLALAPPGEEHTAFTGELVDVLRNGLPNSAELLDMDGIYWQLVRNLTDKQRPTPQARARNRGHTIAIARNRGRLPGAPAAAADQDPPAAPSEAAVAAVTAAPPSVPQPPDSDLRLTPAQFLERLDRLRQDARAGEADALVAGGGTHRPTQEVAAITGALRAAGQQEDAGAVLAAAARRPPTEIAELAADLDELGVDGATAELARLAGANDSTHVVVLSTLLPEPARAVLLDGAARARIGRPDELIALIAALHTSDLRPAVDGFVADLATTIPPADALALADALRDAHHDGPAFPLYAAAGEALLARPPADVVEIVATMHRAGRDDEARSLLDLLLPWANRARSAHRLLQALWAADLTADAVHAVTRLARLLPDEEVVRLADELRFDRRPAEALELLHASATSAERIVTAIAHLQTAGRPIDARRLLDRLAPGLSGADLAAVARGLAKTVSEDLAVRALAPAADLDPWDLAALLDALSEPADEEPGHLYEHVEAAVLGQARPDRLTRAMIALLGRYNLVVTDRLLRADFPDVYGSPGGDSAAFVRPGVAPVLARRLVAFALVTATPEADRLVEAYLLPGAGRGEHLADELVGAGTDVAVRFASRLGSAPRLDIARSVVRRMLAHPEPDVRAVADLTGRLNLEGLTRAVATEAAPRDLYRLLRHWSGTPDGRTLAGRVASHALAANGTVEPGRATAVALWITRDAPDQRGRITWLTPFATSTGAIAALACIEGRLPGGAPPVVHEAVRDRLGVFADEALLRAWSLGLDGGVLAFTDRAVRFSGREPVGVLPYQTLRRYRFTGDEDGNLGIEAVHGSAEPAWNLDTFAGLPDQSGPLDPWEATPDDLADVLRAIGEVVEHFGAAGQSSVDGRTTSISKA